MDVLAECNRYTNGLRKPGREYGFAFIDWLRNGCVGMEPERGRLSRKDADTVRATLTTLIGDRYRELHSMHYSR